MKTKFLITAYCLSLVVLFRCDTISDDEIVKSDSSNQGSSWFDQEFAASIEFPLIELQLADLKASQLKDEDLNALVNRSIDLDGEFCWGKSNLDLTWCAMNSKNHMVTIGIKPIKQDFNENINLSSEELSEAKTYTVEFIRRELERSKGSQFSDISNLEIENPSELPFITLRLDDFLILNKLSKLPTVRYIEPTEFEYDYEGIKSQSGNFPMMVSSSIPCAGGVNSSQFTRPWLGWGFDSRVSWHIISHNVPNAWNLGTGRGVKIGIIDTGIDPDQKLFWTNIFNTGLSKDRSIEQSSLTNLGLDPIGHGTAVGGIIGSPVNNNNAVTGIAYQSSIKSIRINDTPWLSSNSARSNFSTALKRLADDPEIKVINMSVGSFIDWGIVRDAVNYASNKNKMMICATGITGEEGGVYPAMYPNTIAVTGVKLRDSDPLGKALQISNPNPYGSYVTFSAYVERESDGACALFPHRSSFETISGNGASQASATVSGIAALVWSLNPSLSKTAVFEILKTSSSYYRHNSLASSQLYGWGIIDASYAAEQARCIGAYANIAGPTAVSKNTGYRWTVSASGGDCGNTVSYEWYNSAYGSNVLSTLPYYDFLVTDNDKEFVLTVKAKFNEGHKITSIKVKCGNCTTSGGGGDGGGDDQPTDCLGKPCPPGTSCWNNQCLPI